MLAQTPRDFTERNKIAGIQFGINQVRDENLHGMVSTGTLTSLHMGCEKRNSDWRRFHFELGYSRLRTAAEDVSKSLNLRLNLDYSRSYALLKREKFIYFLGPEISLAYNVSFFPNWDDSHLYWNDFFALGPANILSWPMKNNTQWVTTLSFPVFALFSRPDLYRLNKIDDTSVGGIIGSLHHNMRVATVNRLFFIRFQTEYRYPVFQTKRQSILYGFEYNRAQANDGMPFSQLYHQIGLRFYL